MCIYTAAGNWILCNNIIHDTVEELSSCVTKRFSVPILIQVTWNLIFMTTTHSFQFDVHTIPIGFNILCVNPGGRIDEFD